MGKRAYMKQAAKELDLTEYQLRRMAKEHKIPFLMSGTRYIFDIDLCSKFLRDEAMKNVKPVESTKRYGILRKVGYD